MKALVFTLILLEIAQFVYLFVLRRDYIHHKAITDENIKTLLNGLKQHKESIEQMDMRDKISSIEDNIKKIEEELQSETQMKNDISLLKTIVGAKIKVDIK